MSRFVRQCLSCGRYDDTRTWASRDEAVKQGVMERDWACPACAGPEFDLVEAPGSDDDPRGPEGHDEASEGIAEMVGSPTWQRPV